MSDGLSHQSTAGEMGEYFSMAMNRVQETSHSNVLSVRERQVAILAAQGLANKVIARELNVAEGTIKVHLHRVYQKLGIKSRYALAVRAGNLPSQPRRGRLPLLTTELASEICTGR
jgi:DNA-binding NarL/FixJ family response regulator